MKLVWKLLIIYIIYVFFVVLQSASYFLSKIWKIESKLTLKVEDAIFQKKTVVFLVYFCCCYFTIIYTNISTYTYLPLYEYTCIRIPIYAYVNGRIVNHCVRCKVYLQTLARNELWFITQKRTTYSDKRNIILSFLNADYWNMVRFFNIVWETKKRPTFLHQTQQLPKYLPKYSLWTLSNIFMRFFYEAALVYWAYGNFNQFCTDLDQFMQTNLHHFKNTPDHHRLHCW